MLIIALLLLFIGSGICGAEDDGPNFSMADMNGKRLGTLTGSIGGTAIEENFPASEILYFDTITDLLTALLAGKIDGMCYDDSVFKYMQQEVKNLEILDGYLVPSVYAPIFPKNAKGQALAAQYSEFVKKLWVDGTIAEIDGIWFGDDESASVLDYENLPDTNGTLHMAADLSQVPFAMMAGERIVGYDVDIAARFCQANGYRLKIEPMTFASIIPAVISGKCDFASSNFTVTAERAESVIFSEPVYRGGLTIAVLDTGGRPAAHQASAGRPGAEQAGKGTAVPEYGDFSELSGKTVSMLTGAPFEELVRSKAPDVGRFTYYNNMADIILALKAGKTDACLNNNAVGQLAVNRDPKIALFPQSLQESAFGIAFAEGDPSRDKWQAAFDSIDENTVRAVWEKWTGADDSVKILPSQDWPGLNGTVKAAVVDTLEPMSYTGPNGQLMGFDIEVILLMAKELDVHVEFTGMELSAILASVQSGKALLGAGSIIITPEREEAVDFISYYPAAFVLVVRSAPGPKADKPGAAMVPGPAEETVPDDGGSDGFGPLPAGKYSSFDELNGKPIGVQTGTNFDEMVLARMPDAKVLYFNTKADMIGALQTGKIDAYVIDEPVIRFEMRQKSDLTYIPEYLGTYDFAYALAKNEKGQAILKELNEFLERIRSDGTLEKIADRWINGDESGWKVADYRSFPAPKGILHIATEPMYEPFGFIYNGEIVGYENDIIVRFCEEYGYGLEIINTSYDSILPSIQAGKYEIGAAGLTVTDERAESVLFSDPYYHDGTVLVVEKAEEESAPEAPSALQSFLQSTRESFGKTFIRENRWRLFLQGIVTTLLITLLSILFGTVLGFLLFMLCRNGNRAANAVTAVCLWLVQGMPMVVLLMILYYVIFGSSSISGSAVAVIGFTLTFGASVFGLLRMGVGAVDNGQYEAAFALGFSDLKTFFKIILPQAVPHVMPAYKGEIIGLLKATAVVGYVAVQDLTKMGDIVRSRTYEAFFPLIAVTIIYFVLEALLGVIIRWIMVKTDPKKRNLSSILKGVKRND